MPVKVSVKSKKGKYKTKAMSFSKAAGLMKKRGYSAKSARKVVGSIYAKQKRKKGKR